MRSADYVVLGSTGMLGQALIKEIKNRGETVIGIARDRADVCIDITNDKNLLKSLDNIKFKIIINTVAIVNLLSCEENPSLSYMCNARVSALLSRYCELHNLKYIYISTDHYFTGKMNYKHSEESPVNLCNEYARSKYLGEVLALQNNTALVVRTNIVGFRYKENAATFIEWVIKTLEKKEKITLFNDFYTSSIDVYTFSKYLLDLAGKKLSGIINLASSEVASKQQFISALAAKLNFSLENATICSVHQNSNNIRRNESLGLDVNKVEKILNRSMPTLSEVINNLTSEYSKR